MDVVVNRNFVDAVMGSEEGTAARPELPRHTLPSSSPISSIWNNIVFNNYPYKSLDSLSLLFEDNELDQTIRSARVSREDLVNLYMEPAWDTI